VGIGLVIETGAILAGLQVEQQVTDRRRRSGWPFAKALLTHCL